MNRRSLILAFLVITAAVLWHIRQDQKDQSAPPEPSAVEESNSLPTDSPDAKNDIDSSCLNPSQLRTHPIIVAEYERLSPVADKGPYFESYRGLDVATLTRLADSGDSAAMILLGVYAELQARNDDLFELDLVTRNNSLLSFSTRDLTAKSRAAYMEAADWYYKAALHGRVMALHRYGQLIHVAKGDAVELGWIGKEEFEALDLNEKNFLDPMNAYNIATFELVPEILSGPMADIRGLLPKGSERTWQVVDSLMNQFLGDLENSGLRLVTVGASSLPSLVYLNNLLCPGYDLEQVFTQ